MVPVFIDLAALCAMVIGIRPDWRDAVLGTGFALLHGVVADGPAPWVYAALMTLVVWAVWAGRWTVVHRREGQSSGWAGRPKMSK